MKPAKQLQNNFIIIPKHNNPINMSSDVKEKKVQAFVSVDDASSLFHGKHQMTNRAFLGSGEPAIARHDMVYKPRPDTSSCAGSGGGVKGKQFVLLQNNIKTKALQQAYGKPQVNITKSKTSQQARAQSSTNVQKRGKSSQQKANFLAEALPGQPGPASAAAEKQSMSNYQSQMRQNFYNEQSQDYSKQNSPQKMNSSQFGPKAAHMLNPNTMQRQYNYHSSHVVKGDVLDSKSYQQGIIRNILKNTGEGVKESAQDAGVSSQLSNLSESRRDQLDIMGALENLQELPTPTQVFKKIKNVKNIRNMKNLTAQSAIDALNSFTNSSGGNQNHLSSYVTCESQIQNSIVSVKNSRRQSKNSSQIHGQRSESRYKTSKQGAAGQPMLEGRNLNGAKNNLINRQLNKNQLMQPQILNQCNLSNNNTKIHHTKTNSKERQILYVNTSSKPGQNTQLSAGRQSKQQLQECANMSDQLINDINPLSSAYQQMHQKPSCQINPHLMYLVNQPNQSQASNVSSNMSSLYYGKAKNYKNQYLSQIHQQQRHNQVLNINQQSSSQLHSFSNQQQSMLSQISRGSRGSSIGPSQVQQQQINQSQQNQYTSSQKILAMRNNQKANQTPQILHSNINYPKKLSMKNQMQGSSNLNQSVEDQQLYQLDINNIDDNQRILDDSAENSMLIQSASPKYLQYANHPLNQITKKNGKQGGGPAGVSQQLVSDFSPSKLTAGGKKSTDLQQAPIIRGNADPKRSFIKRATQPPATALVRNSKGSLVDTKNNSMLRGDGSTGNIGKMSEQRSIRNPNDLTSQAESVRNQANRNNQSKAAAGSGIQAAVSAGSNPSNQAPMTGDLAAPPTQQYIQSQNINQEALQSHNQIQTHCPDALVPGSALFTNKSSKKSLSQKMKPSNNGRQKSTKGQRDGQGPGPMREPSREPVQGNMRGNASSQNKSQQRKKLAQKTVFNIYNQKMKILYNNMNNSKQLNQQNAKKQSFIDCTPTQQSDIKRNLVTNMLQAKSNQSDHQQHFQQGKIIFDIKKDKKLLQRIQANPQVMPNQVRLSSDHPGPLSQEPMNKLGDNSEYCKIMLNYQTDQLRNKNSNILSQSKKVAKRGYFTNANSMKRGNVEPQAFYVQQLSVTSKDQPVLSGRGEVTNTNDESFRNEQLQLTNSDSFEHFPDQDVDMVFIKKGKGNSKKSLIHIRNSKKSLVGKDQKEMRENQLVQSQKLSSQNSKRDIGSGRMRNSQKGKQLGQQIIKKTNKQQKSVSNNKFIDKQSEKRSIQKDYAKDRGLNSAGKEKDAMGQQRQSNQHLIVIQDNNINSNAASNEGGPKKNLRYVTESHDDDTPVSGLTGLVSHGTSGHPTNTQNSQYNSQRQNIKGFNRINFNHTQSPAADNDADATEENQLHQNQANKNNSDYKSQNSQNLPQEIHQGNETNYKSDKDKSGPSSNTTQAMSSQYRGGAGSYNRSNPLKHQTNQQNDSFNSNNISSTHQNKKPPQVPSLGYKIQQVAQLQNPISSQHLPESHIADGVSRVSGLTGAITSTHPNYLDHNINMTSYLSNPFRLIQNDRKASSIFSTANRNQLQINTPSAINNTNAQEVQSQEAQGNLTAAEEYELRTKWILYGADVESFEQYKIKQDLMQTIEPLGDARVPHNINLPIQEIQIQDYLTQRQSIATSSLLRDNLNEANDSQNDNNAFSNWCNADNQQFAIDDFESSSDESDED